MFRFCIDNRFQFMRLGYSVFSGMNNGEEKLWKYYPQLIFVVENV